MDKFIIREVVGMQAAQFTGQLTEHEAATVANVLSRSKTQDKTGVLTIGTDTTHIAAFFYNGVEYRPVEG